MIGQPIDLAKITFSNSYTRAQIINAIMYSIFGCRDLIALNGTLIGWNYSVTATDADTTGGINSTGAIVKNTETGNQEWLSARSVTHNASNVAAPLCVSSVAYQFSTNSGGAWSDMNDATTNNICTLTYDSNGDLESTSWS